MKRGWGGRLATFTGVILVGVVVPWAGAAEPGLFEETAAESGLDFVHFNGMSGEYYFPEMTGGGVALLDYDGDGDVDVFFPQGSILGPGETEDRVVFPRRAGEPVGHRLFRNDLTEAGPRFVDVSAAAGVGFEDYGMAVATGDVDGDGWSDLLILNYGPNRLLRNRGDGRFEDVTAEAGVSGSSWSTGAAFLDVDGDDRLDLYVVNYVAFDLHRNPECLAPSSRRDYCGPADFPPQEDRLYRNVGDGRFEDMTVAWLRRPEPGRHVGPGLGAAVLDADGDGRDDLVVANDGAYNRLWLNLGTDGLREDGLLAGVAANREGAPEASMGIAVGDPDADGDEDLLMTHLAGETNTYYRNVGGGLFEDRSTESGLGPPTFRDTGFGTAWIDADGDGRVDLLVANGAVRIQEAQARSGDVYPLKQGNRLFRSVGGGRFVDATDLAGPEATSEAVHRGLAVADLDQDGDEDVVIVANAGPAKLLRARGHGAEGWVGVRHGVAGRSPLEGATFESAGSAGSAGSGGSDGATQRRRSRTSGSFASATDPRVVFRGLHGPAIVSLESAGAVLRRWHGLPTGRWYSIPGGDR